MPCLYRTLPLVLILLGFFCTSAAAVDAEKLSDLSEADLVKVGRQIYMAGKMADGTPVKAYVLGNVEVTGDQFTCLHCHRRSGLGGTEGTKIVLSTNGPSLLTPRVDLYMPRPAYTFASFAEAMSTGVNPSGNPFDQIMPIYDLPELEMKALFAFLKGLSNDISPGVTEEELHIATIVSEKADPVLRKEMMTILNKFFANKNGQSRNEKKRFQVGPFYREFHNKAYRQWVLHVWELTGPTESWPAQLEEYYSQQNVFAMVSGMVDGDWAPIHEFCRGKELPCLLPNTDLPLIEEPADFYTLYFSKGLNLEAQLMGERLAEMSSVGKVLQLSRKGQDGDRGAVALENILLKRGIAVENIQLGQGEISWDAIRHQLDQPQSAAIVLWLDEADLNLVALELGPSLGKLPVFMSSSLLNGNLNLVPQAFRESGQAVHPFYSPKEQEGRLAILAAWLRVNNIRLMHPRIQEQTYYACLILKAGLGHIKTNFYRDYLLNMLDHGGNMAPYSGSYPRLSFGPDQRFLAKGGYLVNLQTEAARWVIPW